MSIVETALAFAEGLALIVSPCILPVLPLVLATSVEGGRKRPYGIILGFVISFTAFALLSRKLVLLLGIDLDIIKYGSLVLLALFGLVLLSGKLSEKFSALTRRFANTGNNLSAQAGGGLFSGILVGMLIGLVWTPCAGPILAAVLVQVIRQQSDLQAFIQIAAFALGAGVPMLAIALTGRKLMSRLGFLTTHAEAVRKIFGVIILLAVAFIAAGPELQGKVVVSTEPAPDKPVTAAFELQDPLPNPYPAPELAGIEGWINTEPFTIESLKGKVVLVDFWTYSCINCIRTLPYITKWDREYRDKGLVIIGVHSPEFEFEKSRENVEAAIEAHGIEYPVVLDNHLDTWTNFENHYWPAHYLIDQDGNVVYTHFGEGHYAETENNIRYLLGLDRKTETAPESAMTSRGQTPESYLGYKRGKRFASPETVLPNVTQTYSAPEDLAPHHWALQGRWKIEGERSLAQEEGAALRFNFYAGKVFLVLGVQGDQPIKVSVTLNGQVPEDAAGKDVLDGILTVDGHRLYELINQGSPQKGVIEIRAEQPGLEAYAFTFGK